MNTLPFSANHDLLQAITLAYHPELKPAQRLKAALNQKLLPEPCDKILTWFERAQCWLNQGSHRHWVSIQDENYPKTLKQLKDPPLILFLEGNRALLNCRSIGMVGSRNATRQGLACAEQFARYFAGSNWCVISGLAEGIDGAAHRGAAGQAGATIAVLGGAIDCIYPKIHETLAKTILQTGGLLVSEYPPGTEPQAAFFPRRNRIIAALSDGLLVVEAALRSGSLITARIASELGKPTMAIPGSIHSPQSKGCHAMIKSGALLMETATEVLNEVQSHVDPEERAIARSIEDPILDCAILSTQRDESVYVEGTLSKQAHQILGILEYEPRPFDELVQQSQQSVDELWCSLTELELEGRALSEPGNRWFKVKNSNC